MTIGHKGQGFKSWHVMIGFWEKLSAPIQRVVKSTFSLPERQKTPREKLEQFYLTYYLDHQGAEKSLERQEPCTGAGVTVPWYTYAAIAYLNGIDFSSSMVLEFGAGASSIYWLEKSLRVTSIESDIDWYHKVKRRTKENRKHDLRYAATLPEYILHAEDIGGFNVIVIDGKFRYDCASRVVRDSNPNALIVFDNADWYPNAVGQLVNSGYFRIDFIGPGPLNAYPWCTSLLFRGEAAFKFESVRPIVPLGIENWKNNGDDQPQLSALSK